MHAGKKYVAKSMTLERFGFVGLDKRCFWGMVGVEWLTPLRVTQIKPGAEAPKKPVKKPTPKPKPKTPKSKFCTMEGGSCGCKGTIYYGAKGHSKWAKKASKGFTGCNNGVFGDPFPGIKKQCRCDGTIIPKPKPKPKPKPVPKPVKKPVPKPPKKPTPPPPPPSEGVEMSKGVFRKHIKH